MTEETASAEKVFKHSTMNRIASSEELDHYIKVTNPSAWIVVLAALLLVGGVVIWAVVAIVPVTVETTGIVFYEDDQEKETVLCFVDEKTAARIQGSALRAFVEGVETENVLISETPLSASEVVKFLGSDFYADSIKLDDWNYLIAIKPGVELQHTDFTIETIGGQAHLVPVSIVVTETQPISIVFGDKS